MIAADLTTKAHGGHTIAWTQNDTQHVSQPFAIEHAAGWTFLHYATGFAHMIRDTWEVTVR